MAISRYRFSRYFPKQSLVRRQGRLGLVTVPDIADVVGDAGVVADRLQAKVGLCITRSMGRGKPRSVRSKTFRRGARCDVPHE